MWAPGASRPSLRLHKRQWRIGLLYEIGIAFVLGAGIGAAIILHFKALGMLRCLDGGDVDLLHRHPRLEGTLSLFAQASSRLPGHDPVQVVLNILLGKMQRLTGL